MTQQEMHVFAIPTDERGCYAAVDVGLAPDLTAALALVRAAGYTTIDEGAGGLYSYYDAEDAPHIYDYAPDGRGAFGITVEITDGEYHDQ